MKLTVFNIFLLLAVLTYKAMSMTTKEKTEILVKMSGDCRKDAGANDGDVSELMARELPTTKEGKCMRRCIMEKLQMIKDGKIDIDATVQMTRVSSDNDEKMVEIIQKISGECASVSDPDGCEYAGKLLKCFVDGVKARGLDPKKIF